MLFTLGAAVLLTFPLAVIMGGPVWGLQLLCDLLFAAYVLLLIQSQQRAAEQDAKVRYLRRSGALGARACSGASPLRKLTASHVRAAGR